MAESYEGTEGATYRHLDGIVVDVEGVVEESRAGSLKSSRMQFAAGANVGGLAPRFLSLGHVVRSRLFR